MVSNGHNESLIIQATTHNCLNYYPKNQGSVYRGFIIYIPVTTYDARRPDRFQLLGHYRTENLNETDYFFKIKV